MALFRSIHTTFWTDTKVSDDFTPEDKYFMLYCLTNPYTNILGCYEISIKQISNDMGYSKDAIESLLKRFKEHHKIIDYDFETREIFIKNWSKYNWTSSPKLETSLISAIKSVKSSKFRDEIIKLYNSRDTVSIPYEYPSDTTNTISNTNTINNNIYNIEEDKNTITVSINSVNENIRKLFKEYNYSKKFHKTKTYDRISKILTSKDKKKRLCPLQIILSFSKYLSENKKDNNDIKFIKGSEVFINDYLYDYVEDTQVQYEQAMQNKYGDNWRDIKYTYTE